jgi:2-hydroxy-3-oxopropionate reductase
MAKVGFIGLGIMGKPMSKNLIKNGCDLMVADLVQAAVDDVVAAGATAATNAEIAANCDFIFISLPNGSIVKSVLFGENGVAENAKPGTVICDTSSVTPTESKYCAEKLAEKGVGFIDAPVSGGEPKAIDGTLAFMCGGKQEDYDKIYPYIMKMGASALLVGPSGSGSVTKLTNQAIVNITIAAVGEAFVLAAKAGADPEKVYQAIRGGLAGSTVLDAKVPMILDRNFVPGGKISINHKDIKNVLATAHDIDVPMPLTAQLFEIQQALKVSGHFNDDHGGYVQYFEQLADCKVERVKK